MKTFFKYFGLDLKHAAIRCMIFTLIAVVIMMIQLPDLIAPDVKKKIVYEKGEDGNYAEVEHITYVYDFCETGMEELGDILMVVATVMPFLCLYDLKNRRNTDTLYSLPLSRFKLSLTHFISGFIQVLFIYTCAFFASYFYLLYNTDIFNLANMLRYFPPSILGALLIYCFYSFFFTVANRTIDGVIISGLWVYIIYSCFDYFDKSQNVFAAYWSSIYSPLDNLTSIYSYYAEPLYRVDWKYNQIGRILENNYMFAVWAAVGLLCVIGFFIYSTKKKANKLGDDSDSIFAFRGAIPLFGVIYALHDYNPSIVDIALYTFIMYVVYRRSFKFKKLDYVIFAVTLALCFLIIKFFN